MDKELWDLLEVTAETTSKYDQLPADKKKSIDELLRYYPVACRDESINAFIGYINSGQDILAVHLAVLLEGGVPLAKAIGFLEPFAASKSLPDEENLEIQVNAFIAENYQCINDVCAYVQNKFSAITDSFNGFYGRLAELVTENSRLKAENELLRKESGQGEQCVRQLQENNQELIDKIDLLNQHNSTLSDDIRNLTKTVEDIKHQRDDALAAGEEKTHQLTEKLKNTELDLDYYRTLIADRLVENMQDSKDSGALNTQKIKEPAFIEKILEKLTHKKKSNYDKYFEIELLKLCNRKGYSCAAAVCSYYRNEALNPTYEEICHLIENTGSQEELLEMIRLNSEKSK